MTAPRPVQEFFSIGEVCALTDLKPHVLRYWESQFRFLSPSKNRSGNRVYKSREVELILLVKHLLYTEKFTIEGARQRLETYRRSGELKAAAQLAASHETLRELREMTDHILAVLDGRRIPPRSAREPGPEPSAEPAGPEASQETAGQGDEPLPPAGRRPDQLGFGIG
ncbi:MAG TPA: MerR family transcriptional regulator [Gemmatimonadales bacterium]